MRLIKWKSKKAQFITETYTGRDYMALDPGSTGGGIAVVDGTPRESFFFDGVTGYHAIKPLVQKYKMSLFIVEDAFAGKSIGAALKLGFWRGYLVNEVTHSAFWPMTCIEVAPSTWQAKLPRHEIPEGQKWDKDAKTFATWQVAELMLGKRPNHDAVASALGISNWWNTVTKEH